MSEFNLSEKWHNAVIDLKGKRWYIEEDVKEFIRLLKEGLSCCQDKKCGRCNFINGIIDKLAGEKLK